MRRSSFLILLVTLFVVFALSRFASAQNRVRFPSTAQAFPQPVTQPFSSPTYSSPPINAPATTAPSLIAPPTPTGTTPWVPVNPQASASGVTLGAPQPFDPYALPPVQTAPSTYPGGPITQQPVNPTQPWPAQRQPNISIPPLTTPPYPTAPPRQLPGPTVVAPQNVIPWGPVRPGGATTFPTTPLPSTYPTVPPASAPPSLTSPPFTGTTLPPPPLSGSVLVAPTTVPLFPDGLPWQQTDGPYQRFIQDTGFVYTFLAGDPDAADPDQLQINEVDIFATVVFNNFGHSPNGLRVTPGFTADFLNGPAARFFVDSGGAARRTVSLPSALYSAYLDTLWRPQLSPQYYADLNFRVGVYSDFDKVNSDSVRYTGRGLGVLQVTPTVAMKAGVEYLDRNQVKILPAGGILWEPDENTRFDLYFPRPKLSRYWSTVGNSTVWWHVGAEYGGGAWTFERETVPGPATPATERVDINDIRVYTGIEWERLNGSTGLLEVGYVFSRDIYVRNHREEDVDLDNTFMARAGLKF